MDCERGSSRLRSGAVLSLPISRAAVFVLVRPHYPENVGAVARAMKVMGFSRLVLVKPGRLAVPEHEMARKMAVKSTDVLLAAQNRATLEEALEGCAWAFATTARRGVSGIVTPRHAAHQAVLAADRGQNIAFVLGNEKTGLSAEDRALCAEAIRIPIAADQPSLNLAHAAQILAYELFTVALEHRSGAPAPENGPIA
jgi:TrmH family RNA methyltransferase